MLCGGISPTKKPDWDNIGKIISDALNKFAFKDDSQITDVRILKKYAQSPKFVVQIGEYQEANYEMYKIWKISVL